MSKQVRNKKYTYFNEWKKGVKCSHPRTSNIDYDKLRRLIEEGFSAKEIGEELGLCYVTINKYVNEKLEDIYILKLKETHAYRQKKGGYKHGNSIYQKYKKDKCELCGSTEKLTCHHIEPAEYNDSWNIIKANNDPDNIQTLCASCHLKVHYQCLNRPVNLLKDPSTGRYLPKEDK